MKKLLLVGLSCLSAQVSTAATLSDRARENFQEKYVRFFEDPYFRGRVSIGEITEQDLNDNCSTKRAMRIILSLPKDYDSTKKPWRYVPVWEWFGSDEAVGGKLPQSSHTILNVDAHKIDLGYFGDDKLSLRIKEKNGSLCFILATHRGLFGLLGTQAVVSRGGAEYSQRPTSERFLHKGQKLNFKAMTMRKIQDGSLIPSWVTEIIIPVDQMEQFPVREAPRKSA